MNFYSLYELTGQTLTLNTLFNFYYVQALKFSIKDENVLFLINVLYERTYYLHIYAKNNISKTIEMIIKFTCVPLF